MSLPYLFFLTAAMSMNQAVSENNIDGYHQTYPANLLLDILTRSLLNLTYPVEKRLGHVTVSVSPSS
jgi:hypothetical protein